MSVVRTFCTGVSLVIMVAWVSTSGAIAAPLSLTDVVSAQPKTAGNAAPNVLSPELREAIVAQGAMPLENGTTGFLFYGYSGDGLMLPTPGDVQTTTHNVEATKTEPDKNTYLVLPDQHGLDPNDDYGTHFLFQGHESGIGDANTSQKQGTITRINLDADGAHRVTLFAAADIAGNPLPVFDGSTWDPFAQRLLFTAELGSDGGVWQATVDFPSTVEDISGVLGRGGYEGIQNDADGNVWIVEDVGGPSGTVNPQAKQPNSFLYRFIPHNPQDLKEGGELQALQVFSLDAAGDPITFHADQADADALSQDRQDLHTYGKVFKTQWITIHNTATDGTTPFDTNALAKAAGATPFKRPENGVFRPGTDFQEFFFTETGDTNADTQAGSEFGGFGAIYQLTQSSPSDQNGQLTLLYRGDLTHTGFDNLAFWSANQLVVVEDAGDTLHTQRNALDSAYLFELDVDYSDPSQQPVRILAQGRDASATLDSGLGALPDSGFQNDGDNELTGIHISDGDPTPDGLLGAKLPSPFQDGWRVFYTQQHGDNTTWEILDGCPECASPL